ncbi:hypothetical protein [Vibrio vulnificus]|uniref:hypothetical protein n=1 Tax=Vibrio vulnificus TaxID=672 RepID=UPI0019D4CFEE|nr:hypothetical protein [Vibrio vulnificus]EHU0329518.1 hypothetical protein [Vibrio vulnificus]EHV9835909.1 hypothetical protein [Vibrio vulnificus]MBN8033462.1 hypothetical protein [Vibrio vulnificus]HAS8523307.1 hypothetical protein [Vibrio vulnificus]
MPSLREQLPNGSNRNKVEFLADYLDNQGGDSSNGTTHKPLKGFRLDGSKQEYLNAPDSGKLSGVRRVTFDMYAEERHLPYIRDKSADPEHWMYLVGFAFHMNLKIGIDPLTATRDDYVSFLGSSSGLIFVDGEQIPIRGQVGWLFDGRKHSVEIVYPYGKSLPNIGGRAFTGCIWNVRAYDEADQLIFHLPLNDGEGDTFFDLVSNQEMRLLRMPEGQSQWIDLPICPCLAAAV